MTAAPATAQAPGRPPAGDAARRALNRRHATIVLGPWRLRVERRAAVVYLGLVVGIGALAIVGLTLGDYGIGARQVVSTLLGHGSDPLASYFVTGVRAPRVVTALLVGAALGAAGAIFQTLSGNPLGSPDLIGFTTGAATGALLQIIVFGGGTTAVASGALVGGLVTAALVYGLSWRGGVAGFRLVLVGIGIAAALGAVNALLVIKASLVAAQTAAQWLAGSLNAALWPEAGLLGGALVVLLPAAACLSRPLSMLVLGDSIATGVGVRTERTRLLLIVVGVALVAAATAATGPVAFVALAAPHLVRRITRTSGVALAGSSLMGAFLVLGSDILAQRVLAPTQLAVGVVTGSLGGLYLIVLLATEWRRHRG